MINSNTCNLLISYQRKLITVFFRAYLHSCNTECSVHKWLIWPQCCGGAVLTWCETSTMGHCSCLWCWWFYKCSWHVFVWINHHIIGNFLVLLYCLDLELRNLIFTISRRQFKMSFFFALIWMDTVLITFFKQKWSSSHENAHNHTILTTKMLVWCDIFTDLASYWLCAR